MEQMLKHHDDEATQRKPHTDTLWKENTDRDCDNG
jgi:hypothetical protein